DLANLQTDERRKQERAAEQAARESREAEHQLQQEQAALAETQRRAERAARTAQDASLRNGAGQGAVAELVAEAATAPEQNPATRSSRRPVPSSAGASPSSAARRRG